MNPASKAIWIDLDNSPHVPLFAPIIKHYRDCGIEVVLTARDHSQTIELLQLKGFGGTFETVGRHYGKSRTAKVRGLLVRARQLAAYIRKVRSRGANIAVAVSHGSRSMVLAAWWLKVPVISMYDYEFTETSIFNRFSDKVLVPESIPGEVLDEIGLVPGKRVRYPGIKEELYTRSFKPTPGFRQHLLDNNFKSDHADMVLAVLRPPATTANYHSRKSDLLLNDILSLLTTTPGIATIVVPRTPEQGDAIKRLITGKGSGSDCVILQTAADGLELAFAADLLISGGGTMNREAALLGVPVYSIFAGRQGALDRQMEHEGLITFIREPGDLSKIRLETRQLRQTDGLTDRVENFVIEQIDRYLDK